MKSHFLQRFVIIFMALSFAFQSHSFELQRYADGPNQGKVKSIQFDATRKVEYSYEGDKIKRVYVGFRNVPKCSNLSVQSNALDEAYCQERGVLDEFFLDIKQAPAFLTWVGKNIVGE